MNILELGAIGELVGGVAVMVTLIYLAVQVRQNTKIVRASSMQAPTDSSSTFLTSITRSSTLTKSILKYSWNNAPINVFPLPFGPIKRNMCFSCIGSYNRTSLVIIKYAALS